MIQRYSSRRSSLKNFLPTQLQGASRYDRIAGFFSSSLLEVAGEALERMTQEGGEACVRVVCNSCLQPLDVQTARAAKWGMHREWCASFPVEIGDPMKMRLQRLYDFLSSGLLRVKVLPDEAFGLIHGKAGVITRKDGSRVCFIGSANESRTAWVNNYELVWLDENEEGVQWVQEEFDALWSSPFAVDLAEAVVQDVARLIHRIVVPDIAAWKQEEAKPAGPIVELPIYRRENGLWAHQKSFVKLAFDAHKNGGARYLLADQVGLGKTVQLALAAKLMALYGDKPILILVPRPLMTQWQDELWNLLELPSARWNGRQWIDEQGVSYPEFGPQGLRKCPRRIGIMSTGLITRSSETVGLIKDFTYECVILDEAHRARRSNLGTTYLIRHIIRRTRDFLENTIDPQTHEPYLQRIEVRLFGESDAEAIALPPFLRDAYDAAEEFCNILARRPGLNSGFMKTILLRCVGSTIEAGRLTALQMLNTDVESAEEEWDDDLQESPASIYPLINEERDSLSRFLKILEENRDEDPKLSQVERILMANKAANGGWLNLGCIIFSQFYDSVLWLGKRLSGRMPDEKIAIYAGSAKSGIIEKGEFRRLNRDEIKKRITTGELRLVIGTDAASEGLNLIPLMAPSLSRCKFRLGLIGI